MPTLKFAFTKMVVADLAAAERFYTTTLGLTRVANVESGEGIHALQEVILSVPGATGDAAQLALIHYPNRPMPSLGEAEFGFAVTDIEATIAAMTAAGGQIVVPLLDLPEHRLRLAFITDPQGHLIELLETH